MVVEYEEESSQQQGQEDVVGHHVEGQKEGEVKGQASDKAEGQTDASVEVLNKQKETIQKDTQQPTDAVVFYQNNFGVVSPFVSEDILAWIADVGEELVIEAMKRALERGKSNWGYVKQILRSWVQKNIRTVEAARAEIVASVRKRDSGRQAFSREVVPEWFLERKKRKQEDVEKSVVSQSDEEHEDVAVMLERYLSGAGT
ncbi:hypothetical protein GCM10008025_06460 [Ornithinibacillus halotolerans]|uniref:DnaB/C C-terminal domain-containing protein n=2 Tax=Ornithinibacillus halotolerans TaxID=1274357 RepID=A0A916RSI4_9BACI|nr:hypothetical protein GCM10008025_06460 [Ornithinibacillus halotolerans]